MRYGLVLAGGGARGAAHAGVLLALEEEGLLPSAIGGTSAGSITAGLYACGRTPRELCQLVRQLSHRGGSYLDPDFRALFLLLPQLVLRRPVSLCGLLKGRRLWRLFYSLTEGKELQSLAFPLLIPAVDLRTGSTICFTNLPGKGEKGRRRGMAGEEQSVLWWNRGSMGDIIMASCSVPGVFCPVRMGDFSLVDGGVTNNLPVDLMRMAGADRVVAVDIGADYEMPENSSVFELLPHSFSIMSSGLKDCRSTGEALLLRPPLPREAGLLTFDKMELCMEAAYEYTRENAGRIREAVGGEAEEKLGREAGAKSS